MSLERSVWWSLHSGKAKDQRFHIFCLLPKASLLFFPLIKNCHCSAFISSPSCDTVWRDSRSLCHQAASLDHICIDSLSPPDCGSLVPPGGGCSPEGTGSSSVKAPGNTAHFIFYFWIFRKCQAHFMVQPGLYSDQQIFPLCSHCDQIWWVLG